ncbi:hypothetical protein CRU86_02260 [Aliarcobacter skirrowii]|uniref:hypothetical protein n=1 Tax=Aliarcobacter skirrowii TaxID=28200 RepID=UPI00100B02A9|nr:hypothetical protein [Aliarcobacter skirrowii]RXJ79817.1 hypothetical protein CRU86_02260 [Aliarcobacter skirrowii]
MPRVINISKVEDLKIVEEAILNNENFELGEVEPIPFKLKLDGGRFENYNPRFIDKFVAETVIAQQKNYEKVLKEIEKLFNVRISEDSKVLKFELESGSLDLITELIGLSEVLKNMESIHQLYAVLGITGGWLSYLGFSRFMDNKKIEIETKSRETSQRLSGEEQARYLDTINRTIESIKDVANNSIIQKAVNEPKQIIANKLQEDETLILNNSQEIITKNDVSRFEFVPPVVDDKEEEIIEYYYIDNYHFRSRNKSFKLSGISTEINSDTLTPEKRMRLIVKAEKQEQVELKIKFIKDGITNRIKKAYILDFIEN